MACQASWPEPVEFISTKFGAPCVYDPLVERVDDERRQRDRRDKTSYPSPRVPAVFASRIDRLTSGRRDQRSPDSSHLPVATQQPAGC